MPEATTTAISDSAAAPYQAAVMPAVFISSSPRGGPKRQAEIEAERVVTNSLSHPARWCQVDERSNGGDEESGFCYSKQQAQQHNRHESFGVRRSSIPKALISAPPTSNGRRPRVSAKRPATGRRIRAETAKAPNASPAPDLSEPTGPVTQSGRAYIAMPAEVKYARSAAANRTKAGVISRSRLTGCTRAVESVVMPAVCAWDGSAGMGRTTQIDQAIRVA